VAVADEQNSPVRPQDVAPGRPAIVALLTDFGLQDHYVGAMKGAILAVCPEATLVDVSHGIPPHDVAAGAFALDAAHASFPPGTVFVAVVDPGVGSERRAIALEAGGFRFVGPDNGLLTLILDAHPLARPRLLANPLLARPSPSVVFQGRDLFGPAAAHLARGLPFDALGPTLADPVRLALPAKSCDREACRGAVLYVDRFGNLTTNLLAAELAHLGGAAGAIEVSAGGRVLPFIRTYADVPTGEPCSLIGSSGRLELAVARGRADELLRIGLGDPVLARRAR
jgi:S-adenosylmethionine hydrolase